MSLLRSINAALCSGLMTDRPPTSPIATGFDAHAEHYDEAQVHVDLAALVAEDVLDALPDVTPLRVVDAATGTGLVLRALTERAGTRDLDLTGIDVSAGMLSQARTHLPGVTWVHDDATHLPVDDGSIDAVTCAAALHLFPDPGAAVADWTRALRPGGVAVVATFAVRGHSHGHAHHHPDGHGGANHVRPRLDTPQAVADLLPDGLAMVDHRLWSHGDDVWLITVLRRA